MTDTKLGCYVREYVCTKCYWFPVASPRNSYDISVFVDRARSVCPKCGSALEYAVGRYRYTERTGHFGSTYREYVAFERKEEPRRLSYEELATWLERYAEATDIVQRKSDLHEAARLIRGAEELLNAAKVIFRDGIACTDAAYIESCYRLRTAIARMEERR